MKTWHGWTLVELLVVIAMIAIAVVMLRSVFLLANTRDDQVTCLGNVKQLATGYLSYAQDNEEKLPPAIAPVYAVLPYVKDQNILRCPRCKEEEWWLSYAFRQDAAMGRTDDAVANAPTFPFLACLPTTNGLWIPSDIARLDPASGCFVPAIKGRHEKGNINLAFLDGSARTCEINYVAQACSQGGIEGGMYAEPILLRTDLEIEGVELDPNLDLEPGKEYPVRCGQKTGRIIMDK